MMVNAAKKSAEPAVHDPAKLPGRLKLFGGSMSDDWNNIIANQVVSALWLCKIPMLSRSRNNAMQRSMLWSASRRVTSWKE